MKTLTILSLTVAAAVTFAVPCCADTPVSTGGQAVSVINPQCAATPCPVPKCRWTWTCGCFPRWGCPDDYCPHPLPRQCWPPYPAFYRCVPAGDCGPCGSKWHKADDRTWWFLPKPRTMHEALWFN
jgi:hypothetical protein